ncbi:MAG: HD domain-containing protein [Patescibacteria group bacterium]
MNSKYYKKYIRIPPGESIDIRGIFPIIQHPLFQRLRSVSQLSNILFVFPGASHNRFEHVLGVYGKAFRFCAQLYKDGILTKKESINVPIFGLLHDIGHGPFSHLIEELTPYDHDKNGFRIIDELKKAIKESGGDPAFIKNLFGRKNLLYRIIMDKNLGMDKLDYLERDIYHIGFGQRPDVETVLNYLSYIDDNLVIDKKALESAKQVQRLYTYMYKEVYLHKSSLIAKRFLQKMISLWISLHHIDPEELWLMNDQELMAHIYMDSDLRLKFLYSVYSKRTAPSTGLVFRVNHKKFRERIAGKKIKVVGEKPEFFKSFEPYASPEKLESIESQIAHLLKVPEHTVLVVPTLNPWRFAPEDILYHDEGVVYSLKDTQPEYFESMKGELEEYLSIRVCIIGNRTLVHDNAEKIHSLLKKIVSSKPAIKTKNLELRV